MPVTDDARYTGWISACGRCDFITVAKSAERDIAYVEMLGVDDYIRKPFAMDRLMDSVKRLLN